MLQTQNYLIFKTRKTCKIGIKFYLLKACIIRLKFHTLTILVCLSNHQIKDNLSTRPIDITI